MGGSYYDRPVESVMVASAPATASVSAVSSPAVYSSAADKILAQNKDLHADMDPKNRTLKCDTKSAIIVAVDVTGSMGNWSKVIWDKLPMFYGQILLQGYLDEVSIGFAAVGDVNSDKAPIQVSNFAQGTDIDQQISKMYLEGGGGGQSYESYEVAAYYYARKCNFPHATSKPFLFFTGDEGCYPKVLREDIKRYFGDDAPSVRTTDVFRELRDKYNVFFIHKPYFDPIVDGKHLATWETLVGPERVLHLDDPKAVVDVMLGAIAIVAGGRSLDRYNTELEERGQSKDRVKEVDRALERLSKLKTADSASTATKTAATKTPTPSAPPIAVLSGEKKGEKKGADDDKVASLKKELDTLKKEMKEFPANFLCPLTQEPFVDPVFTEDGFTYERSAIEEWLKANNTSPMTNEVLESKRVRPNHALRSAVDEYRQKNRGVLGKASQ